MFMYIIYVKHNFAAFPEIIKVIDSSTQLKLNEAEKEIEEQKVRKSCIYCVFGSWFINFSMESVTRSKWTGPKHFFISNRAESFWGGKCRWFLQIFSEAQINCTMKINICTEISISNEISIWKLTRYGVVSTLIKGYLKEKILLYSSCNVIQINKCTLKYFWLNMKPVHIFRVNFRSRRMKSEALKDCLELKKVKKIIQLQQTY